MTLRGEFPHYEVLRVPNPAPGAGVVNRVSGDGASRFLAGAFTLVTSAAVASRGVRIRLTDGSTRFFHSGPSFSQPASTTYRYGIINSGPDFGDPSTVCHIPFPSDGMILLPGWTSEIVVLNMQAADQLQDIALLVEKFPNGPTSEWNPSYPSFVVERRP